MGGRPPDHRWRPDSRLPKGLGDRLLVLMAGFHFTKFPWSDKPSSRWTTKRWYTSPCRWFFLQIGFAIEQSQLVGTKCRICKAAIASANEAAKAELWQASRLRISGWYCGGISVPYFACKELNYGWWWAWSSQWVATASATRKQTFQSREYNLINIILSRNP